MNKYLVTYAVTFEVIAQSEQEAIEAELEGSGDWHLDDIEILEEGVEDED